MKFIKQHNIHAGQLGILLQPAGEDPFGNNFQTGGRTGYLLAANTIANCLAHLLA